MLQNVSVNVNRNYVKIGGGSWLSQGLPCWWVLNPLSRAQDLAYGYLKNPWLFILNPCKWAWTALQDTYGHYPQRSVPWQWLKYRCSRQGQGRQRSGQMADKWHSQEGKLGSKPEVTEADHNVANTWKHT